MAGRVAVLLAAALAGCGKDQGSLVVARIEGRPDITVERLWVFQQNLPEYLESKETGGGAQREYLQGLIDREIMLLEALRKGLDSAPEVVTKVESERRQKLLGLFQRREVVDKVEVSEEQMRAYFEENGLDREIRLHHILVETEEEARAVQAELERGESFADVARARSIDPTTAEHGGDTGRYARQLDIREPVRSVAFSLKVGEVSEPLRAAPGYFILKVTDERAVDFYEMRPPIRRTLEQIAYMDRLAEVMEGFADRYGLKVHPEGLAVLRDAGSFGNAARLPEEKRNTVIFSFGETEIRISDCLEALKAKMVRSSPALDDSAGVVVFLRQYVVSDVLMMRASLDAGIEAEPEIAAWLRMNAEDAAVEHLRKVDILDTIEIPEEEIRALYDAHPDWYMLPEQVTIREILVETEEEALDLLDRIRGGESMEELAEQYTIRQGMKEYQGRLRFRQYEKALYGEELVDAAMAAEVDTLVGPLKVESGYAIFKALEKMGKRRQTYEQAKRQARAYIRYERKQLMFSEYIEKLREVYDDRVVVVDENLEAAAEYSRKMAEQVEGS